MTVGSVLAVMIGAVLLLGGLVVIAAIVLAVFLVSLGMVAFHRAAHALHPRRSGRVEDRASHPSVLIDATATVRPVTGPSRN